MKDVQVLSTPGCVGCERVKDLITRVLSEFAGLEWEEIDLTEHPELAASYGLMSVPAVVIGGRLEFTGVPKEGALQKGSRRSWKERETDMAEVVLPVEGMDCSGCERNIEFALATVKGVSEAKADHRAKTVKVTFDPLVTTEVQLRRLIEDVGYRVSS